MRFKEWLARVLFPAPVREITIDVSVIGSLSDMASGAHPKEMLALLSSTKGNRKGNVHIDELQLQAYYASLDSASIVLSNLPMNNTILGTVHSHPGGNNRPSAADKLLFSKFGYVHAIIAEPYTANTIAFYNKNGERIAVRIQ